MRWSVRRPGAVVAAVALGLGVAAAPSAAQEPPPPGLGVRLLEAPTARADDPRARAYVVDHVQAGQRFSRRFEVSNGDAAPMEVRLYPAVAEIAAGEFSIGSQEDAGSIADWVRITPSTAVLEPGQRLEAVAEFAVPEDAPDGEHYGALVAERPPPDTAAGVGVGLRAAVRVYLSVGDGEEPATDFSIDTLQAGRDAEGRPVVEAAVTNTGGRALDMSGELTLSEGPAGLSAGPFDARLGTTLGIGQSAPVTVVLDAEIPAGPWKAVLELRSGTLVRASEAEITFPEAAGTTSAAVAARELPLDEDNPWVIGAAAAIGVLSLVLLGLGLNSFRGRRRPVLSGT